MTIDDTTITQTGALLGTPGYMAPEQLRGDSTVGPAVDTYALGAILFEILTAEPLHPRGAGAIASALDTVETSPAARATFPILESTWSLVDGALVVRPTAMNLDGAPAVLLLAATNISMVVVMGLVSRASSLAWRTANRRVEIQQWHLQHLLPAEPPEAHRDIENISRS